MHHVFISYSRRDRDIAIPVAEELERRGVPVWIDTESIPEAVPWRDEISVALRSADLIVCIQTDAWTASPNCRSEYDEADRVGKLIASISPDGGSRDELCDMVQSIVAEVPESYRLSTVTLTRSRAWAEGGRRRYLLPSAGQMRGQRAAARSTGSEADPVVADFFRATRRRTIGRVVMATLAALATGAVLVGLATIPRLQERVMEQVADEAKVTAEESTIGVLQSMNPAIALKALVANEDRSELADVRLQYLVSMRWPVEAIGGDVLTPTLAATSGELTATVTANGGWRVVDRDDVILRATGAGHETAAIAWSPDGRQLAVAGVDGVTIHNAKTGTLTSKLAGPAGAATAVKWNDDGSLDAAFAQGTFRWSLQTLLAPYIADDAWVIAAAGVGEHDAMIVADRRGGLQTIAPDGTVLASTGSSSMLATTLLSLDDGTVAAIERTEGGSSVIVMDASLGESLRVTLPPECEGTSLAATNQRIVVSCIPADLLVLIDRESGKVRTARVDTEIIAVAAQGDSLYLRSRIGQTAMAPIDDPSSIRWFPSFRACPADTGSLVVVPGAERLLFSGPGVAGACRSAVTTLSDGEPRWLTLPFVGATRSQASVVSPDGRRAALGFDDGTVWVVAETDGALKELARIETTGSQIRGIRFSDDGDVVIAVTTDGSVIREPIVTDPEPLASEIIARLLTMKLLR